jgi:hypothetical protein
MEIVYLIMKSFFCSTNLGLLWIDGNLEDNPKEALYISICFQMFPFGTPKRSPSNKHLLGDHITLQLSILQVENETGIQGSNNVKRWPRNELSHSRRQIQDRRHTEQ